MSITIKSVSGRVVFTSANAASVKEAVCEAVSRGANLARANLARADLARADLARANLARAKLARADLARANLAGANLAGANLAGANLVGADLAVANLAGANLAGADLVGANLARANLVGANLDDYTIAQTSILPDEGDVIGWKRARKSIVKLRIPDGAERSNATGRKCRAASAEVLAIYAPDGAEVSVAVSGYDSTFVYRVGETVTPREPFNPDRWVECASGIHFYITRIEAEKHVH